MAFLPDIISFSAGEALEFAQRGHCLSSGEAQTAVREDEGDEIGLKFSPDLYLLPSTKLFPDRGPDPPVPHWCHLGFSEGVDDARKGKKYLYNIPAIPP
ncbi:hypothetical protein AVEN_155166-1 [Araneus ventricosus]|uniref:Uncharacterized protein n=1 Tax=Araneus ventricosus TaxID=182803 RepID=A0A4Y2QAD6_ARAVE|nr:hypothetical protein AVEN_146753-1 [Araneus ventricosus]GBN59578.1 hypothetical protein AVEN_155166-1 [Araneus ventricosus]